MSVKAETLVKLIEKRFPEIDDVRVNKSDEVFLGNVAEGGTIDGLPACDYDACSYDPHEISYVLGVHRKLAKVVENAGWFVECCDPGTYHAYPA